MSHGYHSAFPHRERARDIQRKPIPNRERGWRGALRLMLTGIVWKHMYVHTGVRIYIGRWSTNPRSTTELYFSQLFYYWVHMYALALQLVRTSPNSSTNNTSTITYVRIRLPYIHDSTWSLHDMVLVLRTYVRILSDHFTSRSSCIVPCDRWFPGCLCTYVRTSGSGDHGKYASMPQRVLTYVRMYARSLHVRTYVHTFNERKGITCSYVRTSAPTLMRHRITRTCVRTYVRTYVRNYACAYCCH